MAHHQLHAHITPGFPARQPLWPICNSPVTFPYFCYTAAADSKCGARRDLLLHGKRQRAPHPAAERQRPQEADQIESRNKKLHTLLCAARAVPFSQGLTMRGQGACPLRSLGVSKGPFSTVENGPFAVCRGTRSVLRSRLGLEHI